MADISEVLKAAIPGGSVDFPEPTERDCAEGCGTRVRGPGPTVCGPCLVRLETADRRRQEALALAPAIESIPNTWRWAVLGDPLLVDRARGVGREVVVAVATEQPWPNGVTILGAGGLGKTSLACAILRHWVELAPPPVERRREARFASARVLPRLAQLSAAYREAMDAPFLVLDEVGGEGDMPSARAAVADVLSERHAWERPTVVTTYLDEAGIVARYGDGIARRLFERALVIDLGRPR